LKTTIKSMVKIRSEITIAIKDKNPLRII